MSAATTTEPAAAPQRAAGSGFLTTATDSAAISWRNLLAYRRVPSMIVAATVQPVLTVLLFTFIFGGAILVPGRDYVDYLVPGILGWSVVIGAQGTAVGLATDVKSGLIQRMWSLPMSRSAFLTGRILADTARNVFVIVLVYVMGLLVGFRTHASALSVLAGSALIVLFGFAASWIFATIGLSVGDPEAASTATLPPMVLLVFSSTAFVPAESMKGWLQPYAKHQPLSSALSAVRALVLGGPVTRPLVEALAWIVALLAVFVPLAVRAYRKAA